MSCKFGKVMATQDLRKVTDRTITRSEQEPRGLQKACVEEAWDSLLENE